MRNIVLTIALLIITNIFCSGQSAERKAFASSYEHEYNSDYKNAISDLKSVYNANSYEINLRLGWLYYNYKDYLKSKEYYKKAMKIKPSSIEAMFGYIYPLAALENWDEVISVCTSILTLDPKNYTANLRMANIYNYRKDFNRALSYAEVIGKSSPFDYSTNLVLGQICIGLGKIDEAKTYLNKALLYYPESEEASSLLEGL